jgi:hypothetical protein
MIALKQFMKQNCKTDKQSMKQSRKTHSQSSFAITCEGLLSKLTLSDEILKNHEIPDFVCCIVFSMSIASFTSTCALVPIRRVQKVVPRAVRMTL